MPVIQDECETPAWSSWGVCADDTKEKPSEWGSRHSGMLPFSDVHKWNRKEPPVSSWFPRHFDSSMEFRDRMSDVVLQTGHFSSVSKVISNPSYLRVIAMASRSQSHLSVLLKELGQEPYHWFAALEAVTGENPVPPGGDFDDAVRAWIQWGCERGLI